MGRQTTFSTIAFTGLAAVTLGAAAFCVAIINEHVEGRGGWALEAARVEAHVDANNQGLRLNLLRHEIEAARYAQAAVDGHRFCTPAMGECNVLLGVALLADGKTAQEQALVASVTSVEARQGLANLTASQTTYAQELYVLGLPRSSERVASRVEEPSLPLYLLQARLALQLENGKSSYTDAATYLDKALTLDPTNTEALNLAISVSRQTGNASFEKQLQARLDALQ